MNIKSRIGTPNLERDTMICKRYMAGFSAKAIAAEFSLSAARVRVIYRGSVGYRKQQQEWKEWEAFCSGTLA